MASGKNIGYVRVSTVAQNTDRQLDGVALDKVFTDKVSGKDTDRSELQRMLEWAREGDTVIVHSMDRLARNLTDLRAIVEGLTARGIRVRFEKEGLTFSGDDTPMAKLMLNMIGAVAEFERSIILERQREGIAVAKSKGLYKGRKAALSAEQAEELRQKADAGASKAALAREYGIHRDTVYQYLLPMAIAANAVAESRRK
jgi:DNA invertase Pin-like site-specific DNA recombinase